MQYACCFSNSGTTMVEVLEQGAASAQARRAMIDSQLRVSGVNSDAVRERMLAVAREDFLPMAARTHAYIDRAIPLGNGRMLAAPLVQGRMLELAAPDKEDKALIVDGGSGYLAELLRPMVGSLEVVTPEIAGAGGAAGAGDGARGAADDFTLLVIDGAIEQLPPALVARLADGARIVCGVVENGVTRLATGRSHAGQVALLPQSDMGIPVLNEFAAPSRWSF
jgi:protein-L-isoaspartate(D-aspartate) O-methyltransferase